MTKVLTGTLITLFLGLCLPGHLENDDDDDDRQTEQNRVTTDDR